MQNSHASSRDINHAFAGCILRAPHAGGLGTFRKIFAFCCTSTL